MMERILSVQSSYNYNDIAALNRLLMRPRRKFLWLVLAIFVLNVLLLLPASTEYLAAGSLPYVLILLISVVVLNSSLQARLSFGQIKRNGNTLLQRFTLEENAFVTANERGNGQFLWSHVPRLEQDEDRLFVFTSARCAYIIPRRAFNSTDDYNQFVNTAETLWREHRAP